MRPPVAVALAQDARQTGPDQESPKVSTMVWHFEFYRVNSDGTRTGGDRITDTSESIDQAAAQGKSMMENITFGFGKANLCVIKNQNGTPIREVSRDA